MIANKTSFGRVSHTFSRINKCFEIHKWVRGKNGILTGNIIITLFAFFLNCVHCYNSFGACVALNITIINTGYYCIKEPFPLMKLTINIYLFRRNYHLFTYSIAYFTFS